MKATFPFIIIRFCALTGAVATCLPASAAVALDFQNITKPVIEINAPANTGLDGIFVVYGSSGLSISYKAVNPTSNVRWFKFGNSGAAYAQELSSISCAEASSILNNAEGDCGYIIEDGNSTKYFWVVDYSKNQFSVSDIQLPQEPQCGETIIGFTGNASPIYYYSINGRRQELSRDINIAYTTLEFNSDALQYEQINQNKTLSSSDNSITITPPAYCPTYFEIAGDRFLKAWDMQQAAKSALYLPTAVSVFTEAKQNESSQDSSNEISTGNDGLGGSAPCEISFRAYVTDAVIHQEWQMSEDPEFNDISYRINSQDLDYTFTKEGVTYVRFAGSNSDGSCETFGDIFTVTIGDSELLIPNAFSPNGDGINDIWKVSYRSLLDFKCWIFDRQGHEIFQFSDPTSGWDGTRNGKKVKPGVYYYIIQATGSDGKRYKKSGDINILGIANQTAGYSEE